MVEVNVLQSLDLVDLVNIKNLFHQAAWFLQFRYALPKFNLLNANKQKLLPVAESLWVTANTVTKVSILLVYKDMFAIKRFRLVADLVIVVVIILLSWKSM